jgi:hypothetical protein
MKSSRRLFNFFLVLAVAAVLTSCMTEERKRKRDYSNIRVHIEADAGDGSSGITVHRSAPMQMNVEREPILDEHYVEAAAVVDQPGDTYAIEIKFNRRGSWILERTTVTHRGRRFAIFSYFGQDRWLAAPVITGKNSSGVLRFTPDATREEAERIVRGLNNVARKLERKENWPFGGPLDR